MHPSMGLQPIRKHPCGCFVMLVSEERLECIPRWGSQPIKKTPLRMFCDACERGEARMHPSMGLSTNKENTLADVL